MCYSYCFCNHTLVMTRNGLKRIDSLKPFEEILTLRRKDGSIKWTPFITYAHKEDNARTEFIVLKFSNGTFLKVTGEHLLYVSGSKGERVDRRARDIAEGDKLFCSPENGRGMIVEVEQKDVEIGTGFCTPLTFTGDFLANGILVTCYAEVNDFAAAHFGLAPLRLWSKIWKSKKETSGIHGYAKFLIKIRNMLPKVITDKYA